jgi:hypothetical protein
MRRSLSPRLLVALGLMAVFLGGLAASERTAGAMTSAATRFLASLTPEQRARASFAFDSDERLKWNFIPTDMFPRNGVTLGDMTEPQRGLARDLLKTGLSQRGYLTATAIMDLETVLGALEAAGISSEPRPGARMVRDPERYFFSIFGTPATRGTWGWRVEGHHVSLHFTVVDGTLVAGSPSFFGTNPAEVRDGPKKGLRILGEEEDAARALLAALDPPRRAVAIITGVAPGDIVTMNALEIKPLAPAGIMAGDLTANQRDLLMRLVDVYAGYMDAGIASDRMGKLRKAGIEKIGFAWAGELERGQKHYYRVQGPTFLIEYDNTQNDANHIHSVWRDFDGDFGRDLLREHVRGVAH